MKMPIRRSLPKSLAAAVLLAATLSIAACGSSSGGPAPDEAGRTAVGFAQFPDIAVPPGARMDVERSLVLGARDEWIGRLSVTSDMSTSAIYDFFLREMPKFGWREITTVRSEVSVLTYDRGDRVATVQIQKRTISGARIDVTVSPRGRPPAAETAPAVPPGQVQSQPLR